MCACTIKLVFGCKRNFEAILQCQNELHTYVYGILLTVLTQYINIFLNLTLVLPVVCRVSSSVVPVDCLT